MHTRWLQKIDCSASICLVQYSQASFTPIGTENVFCDRSNGWYHSSLSTDRNVDIKRMDNNPVEFFNSILSSLPRFWLTYTDCKNTVIEPNRNLVITLGETLEKDTNDCKCRQSRTAPIGESLQSHTAQFAARWAPSRQNTANVLTAITEFYLISWIR